MVDSNPLLLGWTGQKLEIPVHGHGVRAASLATGKASVGLEVGYRTGLGRQLVWCSASQSLFCLRTLHSALVGCCSGEDPAFKVWMTFISR
jgi:hypothetical protein